MKKLIVLCAVLALAAFAAGAAAEPYTTEAGVRFGMTVQEVQDIEARNNNPLKGTFETADAFQLYYETDIQFHSLKCLRMEYDFDLNDRLLFQVYYVSKGGAADYEYVLGLLTEQYGSPAEDADDSGEYTLLYDQIGRGDGHVDAAHWNKPDQNLGIDLWYNSYETVFIMFYDTANPAAYGKTPKQYTDDVTGISFPYMEGWDALPMALPPLKIGFTLRGDPRTAVQYMQLDLWELIKDYFEPMGMGRKDIGTDFLTDDVVTTLMDPDAPQNLRTKTYNGISFRVFEYQMNTDDGLRDCTVAMSAKDGYIHMFMLSAVTNRDQYIPDLEKLLNTVTYTK